MKSKVIKKLLLRVFLLFEIGGICTTYFLGSSGILACSAAEQENKALKESINTINAEICTLQEQLVAWNTKSFKKEKVAREELQLAALGDEIYFIT